MASIQDLKRLFELLLQTSMRIDRLSHELLAPFGIVEAYCLHRIAELRECRANELAKALNFSLAEIAKVVTRLAKRGFIEEKKSQQALRAKVLALSAAGRNALKKDVELKNSQTMILIEPLDVPDRQKLLELITDLSDAFLVPTALRVKGKHELRDQIERLTIGTGFLGEDLLETSVDYQSLETLFIIGENPKGISLKDLYSELPFGKAAAGLLIKRFSAEGLVTAKNIVVRKGKTAKPVRHVLLSAKGRHALDSLIVIACQTLENAFSRLPGSYCRDLSRLLAKALD